MLYVLFSCLFSPLFPRNNQLETCQHDDTETTEARSTCWESGDREGADTEKTDYHENLDLHFVPLISCDTRKLMQSPGRSFLYLMTRLSACRWLDYIFVITCEMVPVQPEQHHRGETCFWRGHPSCSLPSRSMYPDVPRFLLVTGCLCKLQVADLEGGEWLPGHTQRRGLHPCCFAEPQQAPCTQALVLLQPAL